MLSEQDFRSLITLYRTGSFHKAAEMLYISQPALSTSVSNLEKRLGLILFERSKKGVKPTPACENIISNAINILEQIYEFKNLCSFYSIADDLMLHNTPIIISSYPLIASSILPELLSSLKLHLPYLNLTINSLDMANPIPDPQNNEIIIYIDRTDAPHQFTKDIFDYQICNIEPTVLLHKDYLNPLPKYIDEKELINLPIVTILQNQTTSSILTNSMIKHLFTLKKDLNLIDVNSRSVCYAFLEKKLGVGFALKFDTSIMLTPNNDLVAIPLKHTNPQTFSLSICHCPQISPKLIDLVINLIKQSLLSKI